MPDEKEKMVLIRESDYEWLVKNARKGILTIADNEVYEAASDRLKSIPAVPGVSDEDAMILILLSIGIGAFMESEGMEVSEIMSKPTDHEVEKLSDFADESQIKDMAVVFQRILGRAPEVKP